MVNEALRQVDSSLVIVQPSDLNPFCHHFSQGQRCKIVPNVGSGSSLPVGFLVFLCPLKGPKIPDGFHVTLAQLRLRLRPKCDRGTGQPLVVPSPAVAVALRELPGLVVPRLTPTRARRNSPELRPTGGAHFSAELKLPLKVGQAEGNLHPQSRNLRTLSTRNLKQTRIQIDKPDDTRRPMFDPRNPEILESTSTEP